jgi:hypothetical protein
MSLTELKMQPTIHLERKAGYFARPYLALRSKCIVGCIFNSVGFIITCETPCIYVDALYAPQITTLMLTLLKIFRAKSLINSVIFIDVENAKHIVSFPCKCTIPLYYACSINAT